MTTKKRNRGGARPGAGRTAVDVQLDLESGRALKLLVLARGLKYTRETCNQVVADLIEAEWRKFDREHDVVEVIG